MNLVFPREQNKEGWVVDIFGCPSALRRIRGVLGGRTLCASAFLLLHGHGGNRCDLCLSLSPSSECAGTARQLLFIVSRCRAARCALYRT